MAVSRALSILTVVLAIAGCTSTGYVTHPAPAQPPLKPLPAAAPAVTTQAVSLRPEQVWSLLNASQRDLDAGDALAALNRLNTLQPGVLDEAQRQRFHLLRASGYSLNGNLQDSIRERFAADPLLRDSAARRANRQAILEALTLLPPPVLASLLSTPGETADWASLARILSEASDARPQRIEQWRREHPAHPANDNDLLAAYLHPPAAALRTTIASHIAVLLPQGGAHLQSAQTIRAGILAAYYADATPGKLELRFHDTSGGALAAWRAATAAGATRVIGPLLKEDISSLAQEGELAVPTLALNRIDGARARLFQFALWPEDELEQVASLARRDGRTRALLLAPAAPLGQRMIHHFTEYWPQAGGQIAAIATFLPNERDYAATVRKLLSADPRADFLLLVAEARDARLIVPQIQSLDSRHLPVYATSPVFGGKTDREHDQDLSGVLFCDSPAVLGGAVPGGDWPQASATPRLFAMGQDAWQIARRLDDWRASSAEIIPGASGELSLRAGNRVHRRLSCARFEQGAPVLQGLAPETPQPAPLSPR
jgi:outer membrane PBP1 activator LpoA protein